MSKWCPALKSSKRQSTDGKEFDTYKVGTVANSCSTMHKITSKPITIEDFQFNNEEQNHTVTQMIEDIVDNCEQLRKLYLDTKDKYYWRALIQLLPNAWLQKRTVTLNYQVLRAIYFARRNHKLDEWHYFCDIVKSLPYANELICYDPNKKEEENLKTDFKSHILPNMTSSGSAVFI